MRTSARSRKWHSLDGLRRLSTFVAVVGAGFALWLYATRDSDVPRAPREKPDVASPRMRAFNFLSQPQPALRQPIVPDVAGHVRAATGEAIAGASVCASCPYPRCGEPGAPLMFCATTDADGHYALARIGAGRRYRMLASASGYVPAAPFAHGQPMQWLVLSEGAHEQVDFVLEPGGARIAGLVADAYGGPIAGALVAASAEQGGLASTTITDDDGRFTLPLAEGRWHVRASAAGYDAASALLQAPSEHAELVLSVAGSIQGRVLSVVDGAPVPDVEVRATRFARLLLAAGDGRATSDAAGDFLIAPLAAGSYELVARGQRWYGSVAKRHQLGIGERVTSVEIRVRPAVTVRGNAVVEPSDEPCASGNVYFATASDAGPIEDGFALLAPIAAGAVVIEGVPAGEYGVQVTCDGHLARPEYERVRVDSADIAGVRWPVTRGMRLSGQLIDARGRGVPARVIQAIPDGTTVGHAQAVTNAAGDFELTALTAGRYQIAAEDAPESAQSVDLSTGAAPPLRLQLKLRATGAIEVRVTPAAAAEGALVQAVGADTQRTAQRVGADRLELRDLPPGEYRVYVSDGRNRPLERSATVTTSRTHLDFAMPPATAALQGQVVDQRGAPVADATVTVVPSRAPALTGPEPSSAAITQLDGTFVIPNLVAGDRYNVQVEHPGEGSATLLGTLPGGTIVLRLTGSS